MIFGNRQLIILKREDVAFDSLADVLDGLLPALALRNASRETRALGDPKTVLTRINNYLSHIHKATRGLWAVKRQLCRKLIFSCSRIKGSRTRRSQGPNTAGSPAKSRPLWPGRSPKRQLSKPNWESRHSLTAVNAAAALERVWNCQRPQSKSPACRSGGNAGCDQPWLCGASEFYCHNHGFG